MRAPRPRGHVHVQRLRIPRNTDRQIYADDARSASRWTCYIVKDTFRAAVACKCNVQQRSHILHKGMLCQRQSRDGAVRQPSLCVRL